MSKLDQILAEVAKEKLDREIRRPCKMAELSFQPKHPIPDTIYEFYEDIGDYFNYLHNAYFGDHHTYPLSHAQSHGMSMVEGMLKSEGGLRKAFYDCQSESFVVIKQAMTGGFIGQQINSRIDYVMRTFINPYSYEERKSLVLEYISKFNIEATQGQIEEFTNYYSEILKSHIRHEESAKIDREIKIPGSV